MKEKKRKGIINFSYVAPWRRFSMYCSQRLWRGRCKE